MISVKCYSSFSWIKNSILFLTPTCLKFVKLTSLSVEAAPLMAANPFRRLCVVIVKDRNSNTLIVNFSSNFDQSRYLNLLYKVEIGQKFNVHCFRTNAQYIYILKKSFIVSKFLFGSVWGLWSLWFVNEHWRL